MKKLILALAAVGAMASAASANEFEGTVSVSKAQAEAIVAECTTGHGVGTISDISVFDTDLDGDNIFVTVDFTVNTESKYASVQFDLSCEVQIDYNDKLTVLDLYEQ